MVHRRLSEYVELKEMPSGRYGFALTGVRDVVEAMIVEGAAAEGATAESTLLPALLPLIDEGIEKSVEAQRLDLEWEGTKKKTKKSRGGAHVTKGLIVRQLTSIYKIADGRTEGDDDDEVCKQAAELLEDVFPTGVEGISKQVFEVMLGTVDTIIREFDGAKAEHVEAIGLAREVARLKLLVERFRTELKPARRTRLTFDGVELARDAVHEATAELMVAVLHLFSKKGEQGERDREKILAPINYQQSLVAAARAQHRQPLDVDPNTGEELDPDGEDDDETDGTET